MEHERHPATPACDAFSFGMVLYEMLTWTVPWADFRNEYAVRPLGSQRRGSGGQDSWMAGGTALSCVPLQQAQPC